MEVLKRLFGLFGGVDTRFSMATNSYLKNETQEAGDCPNCWGRQEYQDVSKDFMYDATKSNLVKDKSLKKAFIAQFVETYVDGISLKNDVCSSCLNI